MFCPVHSRVPFLNSLPTRRLGFLAPGVQLRLSLCDCPSSVVPWIGLIRRSVLRNLPDDFFRFLTAREGALRKGPVVFRLAQAGARRGLTLRTGVIVPARRVLGIDVQFEIAKMISVGRFPASFHIEIGPVFLVSESR